MNKDDIREAVAPAVVNASNYPKRVQPYILGQDMSPLIEKIVERVMRKLNEEK